MLVELLKAETYQTGSQSKGKVPGNSRKMADADHELGLDAEEEEEKPEPRIFKPDLYAAAVANDTQKCFDFLEENVPPTHVDEGSGWTPLHWAATHGNVQMTHLLIEFGATAPYQRMVARAKRAKAKAEASSCCCEERKWRSF